MNFKNTSVTLSVIFPLSFSPSNILQSSLTTLCMYNKWVLLLTGCVKYPWTDILHCFSCYALFRHPDRSHVRCTIHQIFQKSIPRALCVAQDPENRIRSFNLTNSLPKACCSVLVLQHPWRPNYVHIRTFPFKIFNLCFWKNIYNNYYLGTAQYTYPWVMMTKVISGCIN